MPELPENHAMHRGSYIYLLFHFEEQDKNAYSVRSGISGCQGRFHYIEFVSPQEIQITIAGDNYFNEKLKRAKKGSTK